jgi:hypothetical protein
MSPFIPHRLACTNSGPRPRKSVVPNVTVCRWPTASDPESFLKRLRQKTQQMLDDGRQLARPLALDEHLKRLQEDFEVLSAYRRRTGYSWLDAVREEFEREDRD